MVLIRHHLQYVPVDNCCGSIYLASSSDVSFIPFRMMACVTYLLSDGGDDAMLTVWHMGK